MSFQVPKTVSNGLDVAGLLVRGFYVEHSKIPNSPHHSEFWNGSYYRREFMDQMEINALMFRVFEDTPSHE